MQKSLALMEIENKSSMKYETRMIDIHTIENNPS